ncbi:hypothetical protein OIB37_02680 [Streptomyces sp. NBC_00820]|uniref:hypothetical protein n=1 Tax=Streptomyces sp. NBC_00820 TaxID=2975842 RepID=UPI002ED3553A|nr:hypothetical protein OIB37_02680 [Streptomyces sp. NBC_00820]
MIRRTLKSGLLTTVAVLAFLPTAAGAAPATAAVPHPVPAMTAQHSAYPAPYPALLVQHRTGHAAYRTRRTACRTYGIRHSACRTYRTYRRLHPSRARHIVTRSLSYHRTLPAAHRTVPVVGRVATRRTRLNVRSGPGTGYRVIGHRHARRLLTLSCRTHGSGVYGNHTWYRLPHRRGYVAAHYVRTGRAVPWC